MNKLIKSAIALIALVALGTSVAVSQTAPAPVQLTNIYAAGVSFNAPATPRVAGTALYARLVSPDTHTYAFTAVDALPTSTNPFTVTTNIGAGIAQKAFTVGKLDVYVPTAAGISFTGTNTGWQWNTGALVAIPLKHNMYLMPTVRVVKSSVSNGDGYQPIIGVLFGWGN